MGRDRYREDSRPPAVPRVQPSVLAVHVVQATSELPNIAKSASFAILNLGGKVMHFGSAVSPHSGITKFERGATTHECRSHQELVEWLHGWLTNRDDCRAAYCNREPALVQLTAFATEFQKLWKDAGSLKGNVQNCGTLPWYREPPQTALLHAALEERLRIAGEYEALRGQPGMNDPLAVPAIYAARVFQLQRRLD